MLTLTTLPKATAQEVFDHVAKHLLTQGAKSLSRQGSCAYYGEGGLRCAAGCLISEDEYSIDMEYTCWDDLIHEADVTPKHSLLIGALQDIHDVDPVEEWRSRLGTLAALHNLSTDVLDQNYGN